MLFGNTSFIGSRGPNCTTFDTTPTPQPFVVDRNNTDSLSLQSDFVQIPDGDSLTCILPPDGGDYWPYRSNGTSNNSTTPSGGGGSTNSNDHDGGGLSGGAKAGIAIGVILGVALVALATYLIRKAALKKQLEERGARRLASDEDMWEGKQSAYPPS